MMRWVAGSCFLLTSFSAAHGQDAGDPKPVIMQAGMWESAITYTNMEFTGLPEVQAAELRRQMMAPRPESQCLTAEQAANPLAAFTRQENCSLTRQVFSSGTIDVAATCFQSGVMKFRLTMTGTYTADTLAAQFQVASRSTQADASGLQAFHMSVAIHGRRTGLCAGKTDPRPD